MRKKSGIKNVMLATGLLLVILIPSFSQDQTGDDKIWESFYTWIMNNPPEPSLKAYGEELGKRGLSPEETKKQIDAIRRILTEHPEKSVEISYDRIFSQPLTGDPEKDGFTSTPSVFMMESVKGLKTGTALDVGAGQGRNAVWLAHQGWDVTAMDISGVGLAAAISNAEKEGISIKTAKASYQDFDFGTEKWDLIVMILSWAPASDPSFVSRIHESLRPNGVVVFEHVLLTEKQTFPPVVQGLKLNALLDHFKNFYIRKYEEGVWLGDWGGPPAELVRMIAHKNPPATLK